MKVNIEGDNNKNKYEGKNTDRTPNGEINSRIIGDSKISGATQVSSGLFENLIDRKRLSEILNLSPSYISKLMADDGLPYLKVGRAVRYELSEVMAFLRERRRP
jgi:excisionase family DNA binding protein